MGKIHRMIALIGSPPASFETHPNGYKVPFFMIGKKNLPCENTLPPLEEKALNLGRTFDFILAGLCLLPMAKCLNIIYQQRWRIH